MPKHVQKRTPKPTTEGRGMRNPRAVQEEGDRGLSPSDLAKLGSAKLKGAEVGGTPEPTPGPSHEGEEMILYRSLRQTEIETSRDVGLKAKAPNSDRSVFHHVLYGSHRWNKSKYISTCKSEEAIRDFCSNGFPSIVVRIDVDLLRENSVEIIDLTNTDTLDIRIPDDGSDDHKKARNFATKFKEVLIVGDVPAMCIHRIDTTNWKRRQRR